MMLTVLHIFQLGRRLFTHLKVYKGAEHPHEAQKAVPLPIRDRRIKKTD
jgi:large subunit ribosomal protein L13